MFEELNSPHDKNRMSGVQLKTYIRQLLDLARCPLEQGARQTVVNSGVCIFDRSHLSFLGVVLFFRFCFAEKFSEL